ncbi:MAG: methyltransferase [Pseudomonadota bacterium]
MTAPPTPEKVLGLARGFMESRIFLTAAELDLFSLLADQPRTAAEAAAQAGGSLRAMTYLLDALSALGLLQKAKEKYQTPPDLAPWLKADSPQTVLPMVLHMAGLWKTWSELTERVKNNAPLPHRKRDETQLKAFIGAMHVVAAPLADLIVGRLDLSGIKTVLDVGGGSGAYAMAFLKAAPGIRVTLFDLPEVLELAAERLGQAGLLDRVDLVRGNFYHDNLPPGRDLALLSAIIHQNSPEQNLDLFRKAHDALKPGGRIVIRDHVMAPDRVSPKSGAVFAINMLVNTSGGGTFTFEEIEGWLKEAGFVRARRLNEGGDRMDGLVEADKPW